MGLFGNYRKKNKVQDQTQPTTSSLAGAVVDATISSVDNNAQAQRQLSSTRELMLKFIKYYEANLMNNTVLDEKFRKIAEEDEKAMDQLNEMMDNAKNDRTLNPNYEKTFEEIKERARLYNGFQRLKKKNDDCIYDNIYFLPEDKDRYVRAIHTIYSQFGGKSSSDAVLAGVDYFFRNGLEKYVDQLADAMKTGRKLKANMCIDVFKYVIEVAFEPPVAFDEKQKQEIMDKRAEAIMQVARSLVESIDSYYKELEELAIDDGRLSDLKRNFIQVRDDMEAIPEDLCNQLMNMDLQHALNDLGQTALVKQYWNRVFEGKTLLTKSYAVDYAIQSRLVALSDLRNGITELLDEFRKSFIDRGPEFDYDTYYQNLLSIRTKNIAQSRRHYEQAIQVQKLNDATESLLHEAETMPGLGNAIAQGTNALFNQFKMDDENQRLRKVIAERRRDMSKMREKQRQEEQQLDTNNEELIENE